MARNVGTIGGDFGGKKIEVNGTVESTERRDDGVYVYTICVDEIRFRVADVDGAIDRYGSVGPLFVKDDAKILDVLAKCDDAICVPPHIVEQVRAEWEKSDPR